MKTGVYMIRNAITGSFYIGSSKKNIARRWAEHITRLDRGDHIAASMQRDWNEYGAISFEFKIVECCTPEACLVTEQKWMDEFMPDYNICPRAGSPNLGALSPEQRAEKSERMKGERNPFFGKKPTPRVAAIISATNKGRKHTAETRAKVSKSLIGNQRTLGKTWRFGPDGKKIYSDKLSQVTGEQ